MTRTLKCFLFDWGDTVMKDFPEFSGPMYLWPKVEAVSGIKEAIISVSKNRTIALATNAADSDEEQIWKALNRAGLDGLFDRVYCFQKVGYKKPSKEFFQYILTDLGIKAEEVVMVGDNFEKDILAANRFGIFGIWFNPRSEEKRTGKMYVTINTFPELPEAIAEFENSPI